jgi:hypothetical protein
MTGILVLAAFAMWVFHFRGFLSGQLPFTSDAISYYDHIKFFIDSLDRGSFPMWDPHWQHGVPNEFFLRRFGSFNPFFLILLGLAKLGLPYLHAYLSFLTIYYFVGLLGFFHLARLIFKDTRCAFLAYLLLLFSSMGTRLFDSYILFFTVPVIWFFYFLFAFARKRQRYAFIGMVFCLMVILTTYVPFYFVNVFLTFLVGMILFYGRQVMRFMRNTAGFMTRQKICAGICVAALLVSLWPGLMMMREGRDQNFALPHRNYTSEKANDMTVGIETITSWGMLEDLVYSATYKDLRMFKFAIAYVPLMIFLLYGMGLINPVSRKAGFLIFWGVLLFILHSPYFPVYSFLYEKVFYFSYFRNLHFYLWLALIPIFILLGVEQFRLWRARQAVSRRHPGAALTYIIAVHAAAVILLFLQGDALLVSYLTVVLSGGFFTWAAFRAPTDNQTMAALLILVGLQPFAVYAALGTNYQEPPRRFRYDTIGPEFTFARPYKKREVWLNDRAAQLRFKANRIYYATGWFTFLDRNTYFPVLNKYLSRKFYLYDFVRPVEDEAVDFVQWEKDVMADANIAYVAPEPAADQIPAPLRDAPVTAPPLTVTQNRPDFSVTRFTPNTLVLRTDFAGDKFLVYNDAFHKGWRAFINDAPVPVYRANVAFKGLVLPAGPNHVRLEFVGRFGRRYANFIFILLFQGMFWAIIYYRLKPKQDQSIVSA